MSAMMFHSGWVAGSQRINCGSRSRRASTPVVGWVFDNWMTSSLAFATARLMSGSAYIWAVACWKPIAGPPARSSRLTPVFLPPAVKGAVTRFFPASISGFGPRRAYRAPNDSAVGSHDVWTTIGLGHTPFRSNRSLEPATPAAGWSVSPPPPLLQAPRRSRDAIRTGSVLLPVDLG